MYSRIGLVRKKPLMSLKVYPCFENYFRTGKYEDCFSTLSVLNGYTKVAHLHQRVLAVGCSPHGETGKDKTA